MLRPLLLGWRDRRHTGDWLGFGRASLAVARAGAAGNRGDLAAAGFVLVLDHRLWFYGGVRPAVWGGGNVFYIWNISRTAELRGVAQLFRSGAKLLESGGETSALGRCAGLCRIFWLDELDRNDGTRFRGNRLSESMSFLPVMQRELRVLVRVPRTYYSRSLAALLVAVISLGMLYLGFGGLLNAMAAGKNLFLALSVLAYVYVLFGGAFVGADSLSQEKRDGTLGLLFLTDLKGYDIVAGKLVSRSLNGAYCVLAALPTLGLGIFLGGVTGLDVFRMMLALLNALFFSVSAGMLVSTLCRNERRALSCAVLAVLIIGILWPALGHGLRRFLNAAEVHAGFLIFSPAGSLLAALGFGKGASLHFGTSWVVTHLLSWLFLALASFLLPRVWQDKAISVRSLIRAHPGPSRRLSFARGRGRRWLDLNPLLWLALRPEKRRFGFGPVLALLVMAWVAGWVCYGKGWLALPVYFGTAMLLHLLLMYATVLHACRTAAEDRGSRVLELVLTTPLGDDAILSGRLLGLKRQLVWPLLFVITADVVLMILGCLEIASPSWTIVGWVIAFVLLIAKLLADLYVLCWVSVWQGWKAANATRAIRQTIYDVFLIRWVVLLGAVAALGLLTQGAAFRSPVGGVFVVSAYVALLIMNSLYFCGVAIDELKDNLRGLAGGEGEEGPSAFCWWPFRGLPGPRWGRPEVSSTKRTATARVPLPRRT
ncbi:MAG: hypothetical protein FJ403_05520 [Verrucomicrobia bacterium]|nr:hypothetical protein [Verrucomicrobiota bacterium]